MFDNMYYTPPCSSVVPFLPDSPSPSFLHSVRLFVRSTRPYQFNPHFLDFLLDFSHLPRPPYSFISDSVKLCNSAIHSRLSFLWWILIVFSCYRTFTDCYRTFLIAHVLVLYVIPGRVFAGKITGVKITQVVDTIVRIGSWAREIGDVIKQYRRRRGRKLLIG